MSTFLSSRILVAVTPTERAAFFPPDLRARLENLGADVRWLDTTGLAADDWRTKLREQAAAVVIGCWSTPAIPDEALAAGGGALRYYCHLAGTVRDKVTAEQIGRGLKVSNWGESISRVVAECGLLMILACMRRAAYWVRGLERGEWRNPGTVSHSLFERRVGFHGFGSISRELSKLIAPFGVRMSAFSPSVPEAILNAHGVARAHSLEELFSGSDVLVELAALTPQTTGLVDERLLRLLPADAAFVNIGRGAVVDEEALLRVAREGRLQVALDVFGVEPPAPDCPFRRMENVFALPHLGGPTIDRMRDAGAFGLDNIERFLRAAPLVSEVTSEIYARIT